MISEDLTIHQFEHTKLIGENITFGINTVAVDVCCRTVVAAQEQTIIFDALYQCPQTQQVSITIKVIGVDFFTSTNAGIDLLFDLCRFLITHEGGSGCHLTGKVAHLFNISECSLIVLNVCIRLHKQYAIRTLQIHHQRQCPTVTKIVVCFIHSVRSDDDVLRHNVPEQIGDRIRSVLIQSTKPDKVTLNDRLSTGQMIQAAVKNLGNFTLIECINLLMIVGNTNLFLVKDCLGSYKELTVGRINPPHDCRGTINFDAQLTASSEPIQARKITRQDGIFGVFEVCVFHTVSIARIRGNRKGGCATCFTGTGSADLGIKKGARMPPSSLCKHHTIYELAFIVNRRSSCLSDKLVNEPIEVLLKDTFALDSMLFENSIQTRFGGDSLITTIKDLHEGVTNGCNVIAVQIHFGLISFGVKGHRSVVLLPVLIVQNGSVHLTFDLTHWGFPSQQM